MGRHEIRLRRQKMTSRRIEGYKNYSALLAQHKTSKWKRLFKLILLLLFFLSLIFFAYVAITKSQKTEVKDKSEVIRKHT